MSHLADDLCSMVSTISSAFTPLDDDENGGGQDDEPLEMKYVPPVVKTEIPEATDNNAAGEEFDDDFITRYLEENAAEDSEATSESSDSSEKSVKTARKSTTYRTRVSRAKESSSIINYGEEHHSTSRRGPSTRGKTKVKSYNDSEDDIDDGYDDWKLWKKKKRSRTRKRRVSKRAELSRSSGVKKESTKMSIEERRRRDAERKREQRRLLKMQNNSQVLESGDGLDKIIKTEPSEAGAPRQGRKKVNEMTPEEAEQERAKWREQTRAHRAKERALNDSVKSEAKGAPRRGRKRVSEMTPEEAEQARAKWREQTRAYRAKERALNDSVKSEAKGESDASSRSAADKRKKRILEMSPEELKISIEQRRQRDRDRKKMRRALVKAGALPEDEVRKFKEQIRRELDQRKLKRRLLKKEKEPSQKTKTKSKNVVRKRYPKKKVVLTEDEKRENRMRNYMQRMARLSKMTSEEREALRLKEREKRVEEYYKRKEAVGDEGLRQMRKKYRESMTKEQKDRAREKNRQYYRKRIERLRQEGKFEEVKQQWREQNQRNRRMWMEKSKEERPESLRTRPRRKRGLGPYARTQKAPVTEEELEKRRTKNRIYHMRKKLTIQSMLDSGMSMEEIKTQIETPEQRQHRLIIKRIRNSRNALRKRLRAQGVSEEEIKKQVEQFHATYQPKLAFRPYKPRPDRMTRLDLGELPEEERLRVQREGYITLKNKITNEPISKSVKVMLEPEATLAKIETSAPSRPKRGRKTTYSQEAEQHSTIPRGPACPTQQHPSTSSQNIRTLPQQQYSNFGSSMYPHSSQLTTLCPHQQPQVHPHSYSQQTLLDGITHRESGDASTSGPPIDSQPGNYNSFEASTTSSQHEYGSSYYDDNHSPPPASPAGGDFEDYSNTELQETTPSYKEPPQTTQKPIDSWSSMFPLPQTDAPPKRKGPGRPRKHPPREKREKGLPRQRQPMKRKPKPNVVWDVVCELCGQPFNNIYLQAHKLRMHNPNYDIPNRKCLVCGEAYSNSDLWYKHYIRTHKKPDLSKKNVMCEQCGAGFVNQKNYNKHMYFTHGEGSTKENYLRCPICPEEKLFSRQMSYRMHLVRSHPDYNRTGHDCYHCDKSYSNEKLLGEHVNETHPDSYFPCPFCTCFRFTKLGLNFHLNRCPKATKAEKDEWRNKQEGLVNFDSLKIPCEFCGARLCLSSMGRHYKELHMVQEDQFKCEPCRKIFKRRPYWATHLEERHNLSLKEIKKIASKLNAVNREGLVTNPAGSRGGSKKKNCKTVCKIKMDDDKDSNDDDEEENDSLSDNSEQQKVPRRRNKTKFRPKKRNIIVIAEEDELEVEKPVVGDSEESEDSSTTDDD